MEKMTDEERIAFAHGKINRDLQDFQAYIDTMHRMVKQARLIWWVAVIVGTVALLALWLLAGPSDWLDIAFLVGILCVFTSVRYISIRTLNHVIEISHALMNLYSNLANDTTLKFGFEELATQHGDDDPEGDLGKPHGAE